MSSKDNDPVKGSCATSGTESHNMTRLLEPESTATHTLEDTTSEEAVSDVADLFAVVEGSAVNAAWPEYFD
jgi:hypothetical protein